MGGLNLKKLQQRVAFQPKLVIFGGVSDVVLGYRSREIRAAELSFLQQLIAENPRLSRRALSTRVCLAWGWLQPNGQPCDMVCRSLMLLLHWAGHITLPPPRSQPVNNAITHRRVRKMTRLDTTPLAGSLASVGPLEIRLVRRTEGEALFGQLLQQYHYLGYSRPVGEHLKYLVLAGERPVACLAWSSAPLQLNLRDQLVGAPKQDYRHNLHLIAYNSRYLLLPWVQVPHLARLARQISADWQELHAHPVHLLESFVDIERFRGTCSRAANWRCLGRSRGRGTQSKSTHPNVSLKELWVYPLRKDFRERLRA